MTSSSKRKRERERENEFDDFSIGCCLFHIFFMVSFYAFISDLRERNPDIDLLLIL